VWRAQGLDGKDKVRSELRRLLRRIVTPNAVDRRRIKVLRELYRDSLRRERSSKFASRIFSPDALFCYAHDRARVSFAQGLHHAVALAEWDAFFKER
jgi:hypothetical protein